MKPVQALALAILAAVPALPQVETPAAGDPLLRRARAVGELVVAEPEWPDDLFAPALLQQVPPARMRAILADYHGRCGELVALQPRERRGAHEGRFDLVLEKDKVVTLSVTVAPEPPHSIVGIWFGPPEPMLADLAAAADEFAGLHGRSSFAVMRLGEDEPEVVAAHSADAALAIGSAFKLYVLGALAVAVEDGEGRLEDVVRLQARWRSPPSGLLQAWPEGTPVTLATLAGLMISRSDNTATDHLLFTLGRGRVEGMLAAMGNRNAERSVPFLSTAEMFRLKATEGGGGADRWGSLDVEGRRALLAELPQAPIGLEDLDDGALTAPTHVEDVEWFASASDLCRALDWLRRRTAEGPAAPLRGLLAVNPGVAVSDEAFPYVGFKGGSEPGVLNLSFLVRRADGAWFALSAGWNDPEESLDQARFIGLVQRTLFLLGEEGDAGPAGDGPEDGAPGAEDAGDVGDAGAEDGG